MPCELKIIGLCRQLLDCFKVVGWPLSVVKTDANASANLSQIAELSFEGQPSNCLTVLLEPLLLDMNLYSGLESPLSSLSQI